MSDGPGLPKLPSAAWLAEQAAKQEAYAARRRVWMEALRRAVEGPAEEEPPPPPDPDTPATAPALESSAPRRRSRGVVHDARQVRFEF